MNEHYFCHLSVMCIVLPNIRYQYYQYQMQGMDVLLQLRRQKTPFAYPYYPLVALHRVQNIQFLLTIDYIPNNTLIMVYPYKDTSPTRLLPFSFSIHQLLSKLLSNRCITTFTVTNIVLDKSSLFTIRSLGILLGSTKGQLIHVQYQMQQRKLTLCSQFNRKDKKEGFFSRTGNIFRSADEGYPCWQPKAIRVCSLQGKGMGYVVGNTVNVLSKISNEDQIAVQVHYHQIQWSNNLNEEINNFTYQFMGGMKRCWNQKKTYIRIEYQQVVVDFEKYQEKNNYHLAVAFRNKIEIYAISSMTIVKCIKIDSIIRKINVFFHKQCLHFAILPYDDYFIVVNNKGEYSKYVGHKAFISCFHYEQIESEECRKQGQQNKCLIVAGMDGVISFSELKMSAKAQNIQDGWAVKQNQRQGAQVGKKVNIASIYTKSNAEISIGSMAVGKNIIVFSLYQCKIKIYDKKEFNQMQSKEEKLQFLK